MATKEKPSALCPSAITCHAWNAALDQLAVIPNAKEVLVYSAVGDDCSRKQPCHTLTEHDQKALGVDWEPTGNRLLSCSEDRTAYVWELTEGKWEPKVVHLGSAINRAVLCCSWCPGGKKFAVGTGSKLVSVCYFETEQNWWVGQAIKHHDSSVTAVAWHPQRPELLATGSTDGNVRLFSAFVKGVDTGEAPAKFGTLLRTFSGKAWVKDCKWSPNGQFLAFTSHDSTISVVAVENDYEVQTLKTKLLPFTSIAFPNDATIIAACGDCFLYAITRTGNKWALTGKLMSTTGSAKQSSSVSQAMAKFQLEAAMGQATAVDRLESKHQNIVSDLQIMQLGANWKISSSGYDGQIYIWTPSDVTGL